jgi:hypothetical protein
MLEVLHMSIRAGIEESLMTVFPAHNVRRGAIQTMDFQYLAIAIGIAQVMSLDNDPVAHLRLHVSLLQSTALRMNEQTGEELGAFDPIDKGELNRPSISDTVPPPARNET